MQNRAFSKILVLIIVATIVGGGYLGWQYFGAPKEAEDEIADWKTYTNEEYRYEVKYPKDWRIATSIMEWYRENISSPYYQALPEDWVMFANLSSEEENEYLGALRKKDEGINSLVYIGNADGRAIMISPAIGDIPEGEETRIPTGLMAILYQEGIMLGLGPEGVAKRFDAAAIYYPYDKTFDMPIKGEKITYIKLKIEKSNDNYEKAIFNQILSTFRFLE